MEFTENEVYDALGLSAPDDIGGSASGDQGSGAADSQIGSAGAGKPEGTEPGNQNSAGEAGASGDDENAGAGEGLEGADGAEDDSEGNEGDSAAKEGLKKTQTPEERRAHAAERRRREREEAIAEAVEKAKAEQQTELNKQLETIFTITGAKNDKGEPIKTLEEFKAWQAQLKASKAERELKIGKLSVETLQDVIADHPAIKRAEEIAGKAARAEEEARAAAAKAKIESEIAEIAKVNPAVKSVEDILAMPTGKEFYAYVQKGNSFSDAYYLANRGRDGAQAVARAKQEALNLANSKQHLTPDNSRGKGAVSVPAADMAYFRAINPKATDAEIQQYYNKMLKK